MTLYQWSKSEVEYGRKVLDSGLEGARSGRKTFLDGKPSTLFSGEAVGHALRCASFGACAGMLTSFSGSKRRSAGRGLGFALLGGALGLASGLIWQSRRLTTSVVAGAVKGMSKVRDERWLERHPINYA